jgi:hypothetical protein
MTCNTRQTYQGPVIKPGRSYAAAAAAAAGSSAVLAAAPAGEQTQDADAGAASPELELICGSMYDSMMSDFQGFIPAVLKRAASAAAGQLRQQVWGIAVSRFVHRFRKYIMRNMSNNGCQTQSLIILIPADSCCGRLQLQQHRALCHMASQPAKT